MAKKSDRVRLNVGGKIFETTTTTLANAGRNSMLGALLEDDWNIATGEGGAAEYFIDRNPACFSVLLDLLRYGELQLPPHLPEKLLYREAQFYGLLEHVRVARWGPFDGNRPRLSASVHGHSLGDARAVRASPDGGCCVVHDVVVNLYDWMLEEHHPINLDYRYVHDAIYVDSSHIVVTTARWPNSSGGMGLFSSFSGELNHRFPICHDNKAKTFSATALSISDSQPKIFGICKSECNEYGIGVWDQNIGNQSGFFYDPQQCSLRNANKLQWIKDDSFLMVASIHPNQDKSLIQILDFREKNFVWSWSWMDEENEFDDMLNGKRVSDAIAMEDKKSICIVNHGGLGFLDLRINRGVRWQSRRQYMDSYVMREKYCYPKLATNGVQLFLSEKDCISVFSGPEWVPTSKFYRSVGGYVSDMSIGGDRLFALHKKENVFDVWESPTLPNL